MACLNHIAEHGGPMHIWTSLHGLPFTAISNFVLANPLYWHVQAKTSINLLLEGEMNSLLALLVVVGRAPLFRAEGKIVLLPTEFMM